MSGVSISGYEGGGLGGGGDGGLPAGGIRASQGTFSSYYYNYHFNSLAERDSTLDTK